MKNTKLQQSLISEIEAFLHNRKSLVFATIGQDNLPHASYAPFGIYQQHLYVFVSQLAIHTQHLLDNNNASVLVIEDEDSCADVFARQRLNYQVTVETIGRDEALWAEVIASMKHRLGDNMDILSQLGDFILFQLTPYSGRYVKGFGKAYELSGSDLLLEQLEHIRN